MLSSVPHESISLDSNDEQIESTVLNFVTNSLKPKFDKSISSVTIKKLTDGLSNILFGVRSSEHDGVIVKIYGKNSDLIVDRQAEIRFMTYLAEFHISPAILLTFNNGFIYQYVPGSSVSNEDNHDKEKASLMARTLAEFHSVPLLDKNKQGQLVEKLRHYINLLNGTNDELYKRIKLSSGPYLNDISWLKLSEEINQMEEIFTDQNSKWPFIAVIFCHNDTQSLNFLIDHDRMKLIDFEHCARNMWLVDVFNHFIEYAGVDSVEPEYENRYPRREQQKQWLEVYLSHAVFLNDHIEKQMTLDELCDLGDCLRAPIHLYWALWSFLEGLLSGDAMKKFDYIKYGKCRLNQYEKYKKEFLKSVEK